MKIIYQIGRFDQNINQKLRFVINSSNGEFNDAVLSSIALKNCLKESIVVLIFPSSLPFNKNFTSSEFPIDKDLKEEISQIINSNKQRELFFKEPSYFFNRHPHISMSDGFIVIHSFGEYEGIKFESSFDDIVLRLFIDIVNRYIKSRFSDIYIDISSGHNIYISALLDSVRQFAVFVQLFNWTDKSNLPKIYISFSDPIISSNLKEYSIHIQELKFITFFSSPIKYNRDIQTNQDIPIARRIAREDKDFKRKIMKFIANFALLFSSIKNNIPLGIYTLPRDSKEDILEMINDTINKWVLPKLTQNLRCSPGLDKDDYIRLLLSLAFYYGIIDVLENAQIKDFSDQEGVSMNELEKVKKIFDIFNLKLNTQWLANELTNLKRAILNNLVTPNGPLSSWNPLREFMSGESEEVNKRNFLAHSGFERNVTEVMIYNDNSIYLRWKQDKLPNIKKMLIEEV